MAEVSVKVLVIYLLVCFSNTVLVESVCRSDACPCPTGCVCDPTTANCSGLSYTEFPEIAIDYANLIFSQNSFTEVASGAIRNDSLVVNLDLSSNKISKLNNRSFDGAQYLETINLADNHLTFLVDNAFKKLRNLTTLDLSGNALQTFNDASFEPNMKKMTKLLLHDNELTTLSDIKMIFPNLQEIDLSGNQLTCGPSMKWIATWREVEGNSIEGTCHLPTQLEGKTLNSILLQQFDDPSFLPITPTPKPPGETTKMETTLKERETPDKSGTNPAAIVLPILFILLLLIVGAVLFWKKYWHPRHEDEKKYSAVSREGNTSNRVYSDVTTDL